MSPLINFPVIIPVSTSSTTPGPGLWKRVFLDHREWGGMYGYQDEKYNFKIWFLEGEAPTDIEALFVNEQGAKLELVGKCLNIIHVQCMV